MTVVENVSTTNEVLGAIVTEVATAVMTNNYQFIQKFAELRIIDLHFCFRLLCFSWTPRACLINCCHLIAQPRCLQWAP